MYLFVILLGIAIIWKILYIQIAEGEMWRKQALELSTDTFKVKAMRGNILADDDSYLSISVPMYDIRMDTKAEKITDEIWNEKVDSLSMKLANLFQDRSKDEYSKLLKDGRRKNKRYLLIKTNISRRELKLVRQFPIFNMGKYKGGLLEEEKNKRVKPYGNLASRTIGKEENENAKGTGLEAGYDDFLKGEEGLRLMEKLAGGMWRPVNSDNSIEPKDGYDIVTTISPQLQDVATSELNRQLALHGASHGCVVVMEVATGDVKAIANLKKNEDGNYYESYNYAIGEATDPGSTFKLATMISLLDDGYVNINDMIETGNGKISFGGHTIKDSKEGGHGTITVKHAFEVSSNVAMIKLVMRHYKNNPDQFISHLQKFHLNEKLNIGIPGEATPLIRKKSDQGWSALSLPMMSIGYESLITPLQIVTLYNAIANNGTMVKPRLVKEVRNHNTLIKEFPVQVLENKICSDKTVSACKEMMEGVVENGTATNLKGSVFKIAGKTGTAQIASNGSYGEAGARTYRASFCGYFPADKPKYTCIVVVNSPSNGVFYGNVVAGPIFKAVADKIYASSFDINQEYYKSETSTASIKIPLTKNGFNTDLKVVLDQLKINHKINESFIAKTTSNTNGVVMSNLKTQKNIIPDVTGMGSRDAIYILEQLGVKVSIVGRGIVKEQSLLPGTVFNNSTNITLILAS